jgi:hypothetical protein
MSALFELAAEYREAHERMEAAGFDAQTIADTMDGMASDLEEKAIAVAKFVRNLEAEAAAINEAIKAMQDRATATANRAAGLRKYLMDAMIASGVRKVSCPYFVVGVRDTPAAVVIDDESAIPSRFMVQPEAPPPRPDKRAIAKSIEVEPVPWAHLQKSTMLYIR